MRFADALQVLGIDAQTDQKTARRAYLRLVRLHKPEQDPEGFQRIREAWDAVRPLLPKRARPTEPSPPLVEPEFVPDPDPISEPEPIPDPDPISEPEPIPDPEPIPEPATWAAPVAAADIDAWVLRDEPDTHGPSTASPPQRPVWTGPTPARRAQEAIDTAEVDASAALESLRIACSDALGGRQPEPALTDLLRVVLLLHRSGAAHQAQQGWSTVQDWVSGAGIGLRVGNSVSVWLALTRELSDLPAHYPPEVRRTLASAVLDRHPAHARQLLLELYRERPHTALDAAELLEAYAPNLFGMFGTALRDPAGTSGPSDPLPEAPGPGDTKDRWSVGWAILIGILITVGLRVCADDFARPPPPTFEPIQIPTVDPLELEGGFRGLEGFQGLEAIEPLLAGLPPDMVAEHCPREPEPADLTICLTLRTLDLQLQLGDCIAARISRDRLRARLLPEEPKLANGPNVNGVQPPDTPVPAEPVSPNSDLLQLVDDRIDACRQRRPLAPPPPTGDPP